MNPIVTLLIFATIIEVTIEAVKPALRVISKPAAAHGIKLYMYIGIALGIALALVYSVDVMDLLGWQSSLITKVLTGISIGRGSNFIHDATQRLRSAS